MAQYDKRRVVGVLDIPASTSDDTDLQCFAEVAPGKTAQIYGLSAFIDTAGTASSTIEVVRSDATGTALCEVAIDATGAAKDSSTTFPVEVKNTGTSSVFLRFRANGATGGSADGQVFCQVSNEGCG